MTTWMRAPEVNTDRHRAVRAALIDMSSYAETEEDAEWLWADAACVMEHVDDKGCTPEVVSEGLYDCGFLSDLTSHSFNADAVCAVYHALNRVGS